MVANTDSSQNIMSYAMELAKKFPEVKEFFDSRQVQNMQERRGVNVKRYGDKGAKASGGAAKCAVTSHAHDDPTIMAASVMGAMKHSSAMTKPMKPNILICIGDHIIDTKAEPSLIHPFNSRKWPSHTLPDYFDFDPSVKPWFQPIANIRGCTEVRGSEFPPPDAIFLHLILPRMELTKISCQGPI